MARGVRRCAALAEVSPPLAVAQGGGKCVAHDDALVDDLVRPAQLGDDATVRRLAAREDLASRNPS